MNHGIFFIVISTLEKEAMVKKFIAAVIGLSFLLFAPAVSAQAFGIQQGTPISRLNIVEKISPNYYSVNVPQPNDEFESYMVIATPGAGVCKVTGIGKTLDADRYGSQARQKFGSLREALTNRYGEPEHQFDFIRSGALWTGAHEWAASIHQNERTYTSFWTNVGNGLDGIELDVSAISLSDTYIVVRYQFSNFGACKAEIDRQNNRGL